MNSGIHIFDVSLELSKGSGYIELFGLTNFDCCDVNLDLSMSESMVKSHSSYMDTSHTYSHNMLL